MYNVNGNELFSVYSPTGDSIGKVYDKNGNEIVMRSIPFSIMTYNVGQWYIGNTNPVPVDKKSEYYTLQSETIRNNPADVLFLQEYLDVWCADSSQSSELLSADYDNQETTNPTGYIGHSICTNGYEIKDYAPHNFAENSGSYPTYETAVITVDGTDIHIINTHNDFRQAYQTKNITELLSAVSSFDYFILCGDFNFDATDGDTTTTYYKNGVGRWIDAGYNVGNCVVDTVQTYFATQDAIDGKTTDQIITSANIDIIDVRAVTYKLTDGIADKIDHLPLVANLVIH